MLSRLTRIPHCNHIIRCFATRYSYNKTIPQTFYTPQSVALSFHEEKSQNKKIPKDIPRTKLGLASGKYLSEGEFFTRHIQYDDHKNILEDILTPFDRPFYDLCRDDMWVLDPLSLSDDQIPDSLCFLPESKHPLDFMAPGSKLMRINESIIKGIGNTCKICVDFIANPDEAKETLVNSLSALKSGASHVWTSTKLYGYELHTGSKLFWKLICGGQLSYREKKQLSRAVNDTSRLVPFTVFAIIPFSELALPYVLKKFPNFLPSTFMSEVKKDEIKKNLLEARLSMANEYYEKMRENAEKKKREDMSSGECADEILQEIRAVAYGNVEDLDDVIHVSKYFRDDLIVDFLDKTQINSIAKYMNVLTVGGDEITRVSLRTRIRSIIQEDRQLYFEGLEHLTRNELAECCENRGMTSDGLLKSEYLDLMNEWLQLSVVKRVPTTLLLMSNMLSMLSKEETITSMLSSAVSLLSEDVIKETVISLAPVNDKTAMKFRYERAVKEEEVIEEENLIRTEYGLNSTIMLTDTAKKAGEKPVEKKEKKKTEKKKAEKKTVEVEGEKKAEEPKVEGGDKTAEEETPAATTEKKVTEKKPRKKTTRKTTAKKTTSSTKKTKTKGQGTIELIN